MRTDLEVIPAEPKKYTMLGWLESFFGKKPRVSDEGHLNKKEVDTSLDGQWLQLKKPEANVDYKTESLNGGQTYVKNKKGELIPVRQIFNRMYIKFTGPKTYETINVHMLPVKELRYAGKSDIYDYDVAGTKQNHLSFYELVDNAKLSKKLDCVIRKYHKDKQTEIDKTAADILKAALNHKCE